jgi:pimeloyl-[acyl-carrier protein] methyl ester esterase
LDDFAAGAPNDARVELAALPTHLVDYNALASHFANALRLTSDSILIAESFSGPLAIMLADRIGVAALILCNTFAKAPYPHALGWLPLSLIARVPPPSFFLRYFIVGSGAPDSMVKQVREVVQRVPAETLAARALSALNVDVTRELARCTCPILYLRGTPDHVIRKRSLDAIVRAATVPVAVANIAAPHLLLKTSPHEAWSAIEAFLVSRAQSDDRTS